MRFLVDENVPHMVVSYLRAKEYAVYDVKSSELQRATDSALIKYATQHNYIIVTHDTDFLNFYKQRPDFRCICLRGRLTDTERLNAMLNTIYTSHTEILQRPHFLLYVYNESFTVY